jgi:hypothetical protein
MKRKRKDEKKGRKRQKKEEKVTSKSSEVIFPKPLRGTDANGKVLVRSFHVQSWRKYSKKKTHGFFNYVGGRTDKSPAQPQIFHHHQKSKYYYYYSTKPGKK